MQDLTFTTLIAVFEEIFGRGLFWAMVVAALIVTALYLFVLIRDRAVSWKKFSGHSFRCLSERLPLCCLFRA